MSDEHLDPHLQAEHHAPDRTTPQGAQAPGLEHGHEGKDLIFRPIMYWFGGFTIFLGLSLIMLNATMDMWTAREARENALPSPLFAQEQEIPAPRILPNPIDSGQNPMERAQRYPETLPGEEKREADLAAKVGVFDPETGRPALPEAATARVLAQSGTPPGPGAAGAAAAPVKDIMPSDSSGGTAPEDRLR